MWFASVPLGRLKEARAVPRLVSYLSDPDDITVQMAARALFEINTAEAITALKGHEGRVSAAVRRELP